jgi:hypothetical protein
VRHVPLPVRATVPYTGDRKKWARSDNLELSPDEGGRDSIHYPEMLLPGGYSGAATGFLPHCDSAFCTRPQPVCVTAPSDVVACFRLRPTDRKSVVGMMLDRSLAHRHRRGGAYVLAARG